MWDGYFMSFDARDVPQIPPGTRKYTTPRAECQKGRRKGGWGRVANVTDSAMAARQINRVIGGLLIQPTPGRPICPVSSGAAFP